MQLIVFSQWYSSKKEPSRSSHFGSSFHRIAIIQESTHSGEHAHPCH